MEIQHAIKRLVNLMKRVPNTKTLQPKSLTSTPLIDDEQLHHLIMLSDYITGLCVDEMCGDEPDQYIDHHLPLKDNSKGACFIDNWDLEEDVVNQILDNQAELNKYAQCMIQKYDNKVADSNIWADQLLPPWIVFPYYPVATLGWRMGLGADYKDLFDVYFRNLSETAKLNFLRKYPMYQ